MNVVKINEKNAFLLNELNDNKHATVLFFHPQCGHCMSMKPDWEVMKKRVTEKKKPCNIYEVNGEHMDQIHHPMKNVVDGFPTILNVNNGKLEPFEKERNTKNMIHFVLSNLPKVGDVKKNKDINNATMKLKKRRVSFGLNKDKNLVKNRVVANRDKIAGILKLYGLNDNKAKRAKTLKGGKKMKKNKKSKTSKKGTKSKQRKTKNRSRR